MKERWEKRKEETKWKSRGDEREMGEKERGNEMEK